MRFMSGLQIDSNQFLARGRQPRGRLAEEPRHRDVGGTCKKQRAISGKPPRSTDCRDQLSPLPSRSRLLIDFIAAAQAAA